MENRHISAPSRPFANSKARRAEKDVPDRKLAPKRNNSGKKDASNNIATRSTRDNSSRQQQLPQPRRPTRSWPTTPSRRGGRLRSPSLPTISEANHYCHYNGNDGPKTACPSFTIAKTPYSAARTSSTSGELAAIQALRESKEALLDLVTELIPMFLASFPVHEMIRKREEVRVIADIAHIAAVVELNRQRHSNLAATALPLPLLEEDAEKTSCSPQFAKGHHPRSKSSVF